MKKIILIIAGSFMLASAVAQQQDSITTNNPTQQKPQLQTLPAQPRSQYRTDNMTIIQQNQVPTLMRETLQGDEYKGWERSKIYQDPTSGEYLMEMEPATVLPNPNSDKNSNTNSNLNAPRTFRFDKAGNVIKDEKSGGIPKDNN